VDIEYLRTFCTTVELGSMAKAAVALGLTQPAVSHQIRSVELHLGARLLDRTPEGVVLTAFGQEAYRTFAAVLQGCAALHDTVARLRTQGAATLRIGATAFPGGYVVPLAVRPFTVRHPEVRLALRVGSAAQLLGELREGRLDLLVAEGMTVDAEVTAQTLVHEEAVVVAAPGGDPAPEQEPLSLRAFCRLPHVLCSEGGTTERLFGLLASRQLEPGELAVAAHVDDLEAAKSLVAEGLGVGLFPLRAVRAELATERLRTVDVLGLDLRVPLVQLTPRHRPVAPQVTAFAQYLQRVLRGGGQAPEGRPVAPAPRYAGVPG